MLRNHGQQSSQIPGLPPATQPDLLDHGQHAKATRAAASAAAMPKAPSRQEQVLTFLRSRGPTGATRHEIADAMNWPLSSVCGPALAILRDGLAVENGERRQTQFGSQAAVIIAAEVAGQ
ncbi:MAG: hypothetical protein F9B45_09790 [Phycisphaera sp. RhM]|nr:hypothetical protein [Phycisphaera sp. RhM]